MHAPFGNEKENTTILFTSTPCNWRCRQHALSVIRQLGLGFLSSAFTITTVTWKPSRLTSRSRMGHASCYLTGATTRNLMDSCVFNVLSLISFFNPSRQPFRSVLSHFSNLHRYASLSFFRVMPTQQRRLSSRLYLNPRRMCLKIKCRQ